MRRGGAASVARGCTSLGCSNQLVQARQTLGGALPLNPAGAGADPSFSAPASRAPSHASRVPVTSSDDGSGAQIRLARPGWRRGSIALQRRQGCEISGGWLAAAREVEPPSLSLPSSGRPSSRAKVSYARAAALPCRFALLSFPESATVELGLRA